MTYPARAIVIGSSVLGEGDQDSGYYYDGTSKGIKEAARCQARAVLDALDAAGYDVVKRKENLDGTS